jgi:transposase
MAKRGGKRHSAEQIVRKLRDAEALVSSGKTIGEACQTLEVSEQTYHRWKKKYGGMKAEEAKRLEALEQENGRLKKLVAEQALDIDMLKEITRGNF